MVGHAPPDPPQDVRCLTSGAAPLIVYAFRRVRSTSTDAFHTGDAGRAGVPLPSEAVHRTSPSDVPPRIKRERVPTCTLEPPWCDGRDALPPDARQDVRCLTSGAAPLIVYAFRRVLCSTSTDAFHTGDAGRAGVPLPSEAVHRTSPSDGPPRIKRERVTTGSKGVDKKTAID